MSEWPLSSSSPADKEFKMIKQLWALIRVLKRSSGVLLLSCFFILVSLNTALAEQVNSLPGPYLIGNDHSVKGKDFKIRKFQPHDVSGKILKIPASLVDVHTGSDSWIKPNPASVPAFAASLPQAVLNRMQLFYTGDSENTLAGGWILVPRHWTVAATHVAVTGDSAIGFVSHLGYKYGELLVDREISDKSEMIETAAGLIPDVGKAFKQTYQLYYYLDLPRPNVHLDPKPIFITHPNPCAAIYTYKISGRTIHAATFLGEDQNGDPEFLSDIYFVLPPKYTGLGRYIIRTFFTSVTPSPFYCSGEKIG